MKDRSLAMSVLLDYLSCFCVFETEIKDSIVCYFQHFARDFF